MSNEFIIRQANAVELTDLNALRQAASGVKSKLFDVENRKSRMLFFAFDGTGDDMNDGSLGPMSNVGRLYNAIDLALSEKDGVLGQAYYYKGPGNQANPITRILDGAAGMTVPDTVATAYNQLVDYANANPGFDLTISTTGFSRGAAISRAFLNAVWENGIPDTSSRVSLGLDDEGKERFAYTRYLDEPHSDNLGAAMLFDTVATGVARKDELQSIPPAPHLRVYQLMAQDEHRSLFTPDSILDPNSPNDPRLQEDWVAGAHHDVGGGAYSENGIGLLTLDIAYRWLKSFGVPMADLPADALPGAQTAVIHDSFKGFYGPEAGPGSGGYVTEPRWKTVKTYNNEPFISDHNVQSFDDGSRIEKLTYSNGKTQIITRDAEWQISQTSTTTWNADRTTSNTVVVNGDGRPLRTVNVEYFGDDLAGTSRIETVTSKDGTVKNTYDSNGALFKSESVEPRLLNLPRH